MDFERKKRRMSDFLKERNSKGKNEFRENVIQSHDLPRNVRLKLFRKLKSGYVRQPVGLVLGKKHILTIFKHFNDKQKNGPRLCSAIVMSDFSNSRLG
jgi:hypothetical protein